MSGPVPHGATVSYRRQYRRCGKATCTRCAAGGPGHGPYWYAYWWEGGHTRSRYLGTQTPPGLDQHPDATPLDGALPTPAHPQTLSAPGQATPPPGVTTALRVRTLGGFAVWRGETALAPELWRGQRATTLFKCLLSAPGHRLLREQASELLWPEGAPAAGATNLRTTLHLLRQILDGPGAPTAAPSSYLRTEGALIALAPGGAAAPAETADWLDATAFAQAAQAALEGQDTAACRAALARYGGEYLPDDPYADWALAPRAALRRQYLALLLHLATLSGARGELAESEECLRRVLAMEPGHEEAAATLMRLLAESGRRGEALRVYQALATVLEQELEVAPAAEIAALRARLVAQEEAPLAAHVPARAAPPRLSNLPTALTSFVGRSWELAAVRELLATTRLLTLVGPGGCGKTRLALAVATRLAEEAAYPDGVWLVELAALTDPALVPHAVASTLGVVEQPDQQLLSTLVQFLHPRQALLILDNCEHLINGCAELAHDLLRACPRLRLLTTSREGLAVPGEQTYLVPSLAAPDPAHLPPLERLREYEAVTLFLERARARRPELALTAANAGAVAQICARLDGLPLAIELAAARVGVLPVQVIAARLDDRFELLTGGPRTALPRQQTLRAALDWSYALLSAGEQHVLDRLAVFAGGCTLKAAEAVCGGAEIESGTILDLLASLMHKSLVRLEETEGETGRYRLLETVRQYAGERLDARGEAARVRDRHLEWYLALAEEAEPRLGGPEQEEWLDRLETEHDNLRAALDWISQGAGDRDRGVQLAGALGRFWEVRGYLSEGRGRLEQSLAVRVGVAPAPLARALRAAGRLAWAQGDYGAARALHEEALALSRELGDKQSIASSLNDLELVARAQGDYGAARALHEEVLVLQRQLGDRFGMAHSLSNLGMVALYQGDYPEARTRLEEGLALFRKLDDRRGIAMTTNTLGDVAWAQGDYGRATVWYEESLLLMRALGYKLGIANALGDLGDVAWAQGDDGAARALYEERLTLSRELGDKRGIAVSLNHLGRVALHQGDRDQAAALHEQGLTLFRELGDKRGIAVSLNHLGQVAERQGDYGRAGALFAEGLNLGRDLGARHVLAEGLEGLAWVAAAQGQTRQAARLGGAAEALREALGTPLPPILRADHERVRQNLRAALGDEVWAAAWAEGRALPLEEVIALAVQTTSSIWERARG